MQTVITAKYRGRAADGSTIRKGDQIIYDRTTRTVVSASPIKVREFLDRQHDSYVSHVFNFGDGREYYRNKRGRCEDAPCCGCCTI
jgi:hypothetical protein